MTTTETAVKFVAGSKKASPSTKKLKPASAVYGSSSQFRHVVERPYNAYGPAKGPRK